MYYKCCVDNCASKRQDVKLHQFPSSEVGLQKWLQCINSDRLRNLSAQDLRKMFVCHKHFERRFITEKSRVRLGSYPTLFSEDEIKTGIPRVTLEANSTAHVMFDHCYGRHWQHEDHTYSKPSSSNDAAGPSLEQPPVAAHQELQNLEQLPTTMSGPILERPVLRELQNLSNPSTSGSSLQRAHHDPALKNVPHKSTSGITTETGPKRRKRVIRKLSNLPPECHNIYLAYRKSLKQLDFVRRAKRALKFSKSQSFEKLTSKMNPLAKKILWMQITQSEKKQKGRRFTDEEKMIALSILKQSPKAYKFLKKKFILPSRNTLSKMTSSLNVQPGINNQIFDAIKDEVESWSENKKYCSIIFDEMSLEPSLDYDKVKDRLNGFVHLNKKTDQFADHALAFMLRGAVHKWQQPIAYYFCEGATKKEELKLILKGLINAVIDTGLLPIAVICDQGQSFQSALKSLSEDTRRDQIMAGRQTDDVITIKGQDLSVIFDPPHLIKGIRNNFLSKKLKYENKICQWSDIVEVYQTDCEGAEVRLLHKLNDTHVIPEKINKMKVKNCTQVLSKTMSAALSYTSKFPLYPDGKPVSATMKNTSQAVSFFDDLFDSTNGATLSAKKARGKDLRKAVTATSPHHQFWRESIRKLENIKFIDERRGEVTVPSLKNWIITLKSYMRLWQFFQTKNVKIMRPRYFNSDPIENFFGQVRAYNFRNNDPSCHTFISTFKSLLITRFIKFHSTCFNCEEDSGVQILNINKLFAAEENRNTETSLPHNHCVDQEHDINIQVQARRERLNVHSRAYTAGWLVRKLMQKIKCNNCLADLTTAEGSTHSWISQREYNAFIKRRLTYPSEHAVRTFGFIVKETKEFLERKPHLNSISKEIKGLILSKYSFDFLNCELHKTAILEYFLIFSIKFAMINWCNTINKILKGTDISRLNRPTRLPLMQAKALDKFKKKLRNKK